MTEIKETKWKEEIPKKEKCSNCPYCKKSMGINLYEEIVTQKWRFGLTLSIGIVFLLSLIADVIILIKMF